jgi:hypothetical protein
MFAHNTTGEKHFSTLFTTYHIAKALTKAETKEDCGLRFEEVERLFSHSMIQAKALRGRLKEVASYDKNIQICPPLSLHPRRPRPRVMAARDKAEGICMQLRYTQGAYCPLPSATVKNPHPPTRQRPSPAAPRGRPSFLPPKDQISRLSPPPPRKYLTPTSTAWRPWKV